MMNIAVNGNDYALDTSIGMMDRILKKTGKPALELLDDMCGTPSSEYTEILKLAAESGGGQGAALAADIGVDGEWGYYMLSEAVSALIARIMFPGPMGAMEAQIDRMAGGNELIKNKFRAWLALPGPNREARNGEKN
jgi:hypothetical protein